MEVFHYHSEEFGVDLGGLMPQVHDQIVETIFAQIKVYHNFDEFLDNLTLGQIAEIYLKFRILQLFGVLLAFFHKDM